MKSLNRLLADELIRSRLSRYMVQFPDEEGIRPPYRVFKIEVTSSQMPGQTQIFYVERKDNRLHGREVDIAKEQYPR